MKKTLKFFGYGIIGLLILGLGGFLIWASFPLGPEAKALESMASSQFVDYEEVNNWLVFTDNQSTSQTGLILYPGGRVDYRSYAPHARDIAQEGFLVVVVPMPLNFAFFGVNRAVDVIEDFPNIQTWAVGGHSLGELWLHNSHKPTAQWWGVWYYGQLTRQTALISPPQI